MRVVVYDTAGPVIGVAVRDGERWAQRVERVSRGAEARLAPWTGELCAELGFRVDQLDGVGVARGPGAFTGVRVGLAAASGLAFALGVPMWGGSSLDSRASAVRSPEGLPVLSMLDARKQRVYAAAYGSDGLIFGGPGDVAPEVAVGWMRGPFLAVGEGAIVYREVVQQAGGTVVDGADDPAVAELAEQCQRALIAGEGQDPITVRPEYLREADAKPPRKL
ncbi:MAG: tRNA threonylcarbamoyladenosine biosynthesis protein TsaB [Kiritimatiellia bacterium]|jgi:tRNA threonylcarbamoyladenosine biosynthesis protein TsaB